MAHPAAAMWVCTDASLSLKIAVGGNDVFACQLKLAETFSDKMHIPYSVIQLNCGFRRDLVE